MLQRIQSIYLLFASIIIASMFFFNLAHFEFGIKQQYDLYSMGFVYNGQSIINTYPLAIFNAITVLILLINIFLFKNRKLQMKLSIVALIFIVLLLGLFYYYLITTAKQLNATIHYSIMSIMPLLAIIFVILAYRNIRKDDALVRSADRIR